MFVKENIYYFDNLYLDKNMLNELGIKTINKVEFIQLLNDCNDNVYIMNNTSSMKIIDIKSVENNVDLSDNKFYYISKDNHTIFLKIKKYYGIKSNEGLIAVYENKEIRDIKLSEISSKGLQVIFSDMQSSQKVISQYVLQKKLLKTYKDIENMSK